MGYFRNHLATLIMGVFAAILTGLWPVLVDIAPVLNFVFIMAIPIAWFITFMCWIVQKGTDYSHKYSSGNVKKKEKLVLTTIFTMMYFMVIFAAGTACGTTKMTFTLTRIF